MSAKTGKRPLRSLSAHEKLEAIRRVHDGESKASVARDIGVPESTLRGWCKNEDKISFLSRQSSSPEADDGGSGSVEPKEKRIKVDEAAIQPFNLSLKHSTNLYPNNSQSLYTPLDYSKTDSDTAHKTPQNLCLKIETPKSSATGSTTTTATAQMTDQELRRAELARLSIELGLNRPEMFPTNINNNNNNSTTNTINDLTQNLTLINAWNSLMMQQQLIQNGQTTKKMTNSEYLTLANSLLQSLPTMSSMTKLQNTTTTRLPKEQQQQTTTDDYIKSWLKIQEAAAVTAAVATNHANNSHNKTQMVSHNISTTPTTIATTITPSVGTTLSPASITATTSSINNNNNNNNNINTASTTTTNLEALYQNTLWKWSKELTQSQMNNLTTINKQQQQQQQIENNNHKPILYQQLTKDGNDNNNVNGKKIVKNGNKIRSVLDNLLINNNHIETNNKQQQQQQYNNNEMISRDEALVHGEKFMQWLECYSDPMVTAVQLQQFKNLLNNVRLSANRQNGGGGGGCGGDTTLRNKTKERRK